MQFAALLVALLVSSPIFAASIPTLFNTGAGLWSGVDPNYTIFSGQTSASAVVTTRAGSSNTITSTWISDYVLPPTQTPDNFAPPIVIVVPAADPLPFFQQFSYLTTFSLTGFNTNSTSISVNCAVDGQLLGVILNGQLLSSTCASAAAFGTTSFNINSGFNSGTNFLQFIISAQSNNSALRAEFTSETQALNSVPEPTTLTIAALGLAAILVRQRLKLQTQNVIKP